MGKAKKAGSQRFMEWNAFGLDDQGKRDKLSKKIKDDSIDAAFIQEGSAKFVNPVDEACTVDRGIVLVPIPIGFDAGGGEDYDNNDPEYVCSKIFNSTKLHSHSGKARKTPYNHAYNAADWVQLEDKDAVNYGENDAIKQWVLEPVREGLDSGAIWMGGTGGRQTVVEQSKGAREKIKSKVQKRVNLLGHNRPKAMKQISTGLTVYNFHAPLGGEVAKLDDVGFDHFAAAGPEGCQGALAPACLCLFLTHVTGGPDPHTGMPRPLPDDVLLSWDSNTKRKGMEVIFPGCDIVSSRDGLCHMVGAPNLDLMEVETTTPQAVGSDHGQIVVDVKQAW